MKEFGMEDTLECEDYDEPVLVKDLVYEPGEIFYLIKEYKFNFSDEVLEKAHITRTIREISVHTS